MKVLIVNTQSINHNNATGITLRSIFGHLEASDCYELYMQPCDKAKDAIPLRSERIPAMVCLPRHLANKVVKSGGGSSAPAPAASKGSLKARLRARLIMSLDFEPVILTRGLMKRVKAFAPDCIYTLGNSIDTMKLAVKLSRKLNIPIVPHFMDNWQASHRYGPDRYPYHLRRTQVWLKKMYDRTEKALAISPKMAAEYEEKWNKPHYALMNSVDVGYYHEGCRDRRADDGTFVLTYAGGLHLNRYQSLIEVGAAVDAYNAHAARPIRLVVYTDDKSIANYGEALKTVKALELNAYVPHDRILEVYQRSDALVHIESFDEAYREFILYSMSTKISEFLSTGRPVLLYAPADIFACEYLKENQAGIVVSRADELRAALDALTDDANADTLCENAYALAMKNHDDAYLKKTLREIF